MRYQLDIIKSLKEVNQSGIPKDIDRADPFLILLNSFINEDEETKPVSNVCENMGELCPVPYCNLYMKQRLLEIFGEKVTIATLFGKADMVNFNETTASILRQYHTDSKMPSKAEAQNELIIKTAVSHHFEK